MKIIAILAMTKTGLIGSRNGLPWHIPEDLRRFKKLTTGHIVIMGKNTYFSLPESVRPLPHRKNIVLSSSPIIGVDTYGSIDKLLSDLQNIPNNSKVFVIGGASIYHQFFER